MPSFLMVCPFFILQLSSYYKLFRYDPFITMIYMRHCAYNGMSKRDWKIFTGSLFLGNAYWTHAFFMGISLVEWGWKVMREMV